MNTSFSNGHSIPRRWIPFNWQVAINVHFGSFAWHASPKYLKNGKCTPDCVSAREVVQQALAFPFDWPRSIQNRSFTYGGLAKFLTKLQVHLMVWCVLKKHALVIWTQLCSSKRVSLWLFLIVDYYSNVWLLTFRINCIASFIINN